MAHGAWCRAPISVPPTARDWTPITRGTKFNIELIGRVRVEVEAGNINGRTRELPYPSFLPRPPSPTWFHDMPSPPSQPFPSGLDIVVFILSLIGAIRFGQLVYSAIVFVVTCVPQWLESKVKWLLKLEASPPAWTDSHTRDSITQYAPCFPSNYLVFTHCEAASNSQFSPNVSLGSHVFPCTKRMFVKLCGRPTMRSKS